MKTTYLRLMYLLVITCMLFGCQPNSKSPSSKPETKPAPTTTPESGTTTPPSKPEPTSPPPAPTTPPPRKLCGDPNFDLTATTLKAANAHKDIMYDRVAENKADCSGIFHRVLESFQKVCPNANLPTFGTARASRNLAAWYEKNGDFKIIRNPEASADLIQPGAVMFYGYGHRRNHYDFQKMNMDTLTLRGTGINHISIVTSVNRVNGELISYKMFHGRNDGKLSAITNSYKVTSYDKTLPMYGNHKEPWLAVSSVFGE